MASVKGLLAALERVLRLRAVDRTGDLMARLLVLLAGIALVLLTAPQI